MSDDTQFVHRAYELYRIRTGDARELADLDSPDLSGILLEAQKLKKQAGACD